jgi:uncharacterized protein (TIGR00106 family)
VGESVSAYVAEAFKSINESGLPYEHHAMGTNIEGNWDEVMAVIKACRDRMLEKANRISISIKIDDRKGVIDGIEKKVASAKAKRNDANAERGTGNAGQERQYLTRRTTKNR